jgi:hypothetical protein
MRINIWLVLALVLVIAIVAFVIGKKTSVQVVDKDGEKVKGKFISTDGVTATLQA